MSGTAWAAVEYTRWREEHAKDGPELVIVPVGLVYTEKDTFKSRVSREMLSVGWPTHLDSLDASSVRYVLHSDACADTCTQLWLSHIYGRLQSRTFQYTAWCGS